MKRLISIIFIFLITTVAAFAAHTFLRDDGTFAQPDTSDLTGLSGLAFYFHKNGTAQTGMTNGAYSQVTWSSTKFNTTGAALASNRWTAPASGIVQMDAYLWWTAHAASTGNPIFTVKIIKNSAGTCNGTDVFAGQGTPVTGFPTTAIANAGGVDQATAGDVYEVCAFGTSNTPANDLGLDGNQAHTHWSGAYIR